MVKLEDTGHGRITIKGLPTMRFRSRHEMPPIEDLVELRICRNLRRVEAQLVFVSEIDVPEPSAEPLRPIGLDLCVSARSRHQTAGCSLGAGRTRAGSAGSSVGSREPGEAQSRDKRRSGHWPARGPRTNCPPSWSRATTSSRWRAWQLARCELPSAGPLRPQTGTSSQRRD